MLGFINKNKNLTFFAAMAATQISLYIGSYHSSAAAVFMLGNELPRRVINKCKDCPNYVEDLNL